MTPTEFIIDNVDTVLTAYQENGTNKSTWESIKKIIPEIEQAMSFPTFKQYGSFLNRLNNKLNIPFLLENVNELNKIKHELDQVKQELNKLQVSSKLNGQKANTSVKHGLNISGWSIQESGGYFRAFKKIAGKMHAVYLGKNLTDAEIKIKAKENSTLEHEEK